MTRLIVVALLSITVLTAGCAGAGSQPSEVPSGGQVPAAAPVVDVDASGLPEDLVAVLVDLGLPVASDRWFAFGVGGCGPTGQEGPTTSYALEGQFDGADPDAVADRLVDLGSQVGPEDGDGLRRSAVQTDGGRTVELVLHAGGAVATTAYPVEQVFGEELEIRHCD